MKHVSQYSNMFRKEAVHYNFTRKMYELLETKSLKLLTKMQRMILILQSLLLDVIFSTPLLLRKSYIESTNCLILTNHDSWRNYLKNFFIFGQTYKPESKFLYIFCHLRYMDDLLYE